MFIIKSEVLKRSLESVVKQVYFVHRDLSCSFYIADILNKVLDLCMGFSLICMGNLNVES